MQIWSGGMRRLVVGLLLALAAEVVSLTLGEEGAVRWVSMALAAAAIWLAGLATYRAGWRALRQARLNINALMSVAVTGAFLIGEWPEAAMVMVLYAIAEAIEEHAMDRARRAIAELVALAPQQADVRQPDGSWRVTPVAEVPLDAVARVRPGERIPLDGEVLRGASAVNQAPVTGESIPVDKAPGDAVFAGTINESAELEIRVTAAAQDTTLARIIRAVEAAQATRAPTQRFVDRFAAFYTPAIFILALFVAIAGPWLAGWTWMTSIYRALVLLVVACPCALVIATPVTVVSALAQAARRGILIKGGVYLENARRLRVVALDKTGTITEGKPRLVQQARIDDSLDEPGLWAVAESLAGRSDHPVSRAIAAGLDAEALPVEGFHALPGRGVAGTVDGRAYVLGNHRLIEERGQCGEALESRLREQEAAGRTVTLLASDRRVLALFAVADTIKAGSRDAIVELAGLGVRTVMLSGDNATTARVIGEQAGVAEARGDLLPEQKQEVVQALQSLSGHAAMVGDGINDAPALSQADIGIAMGGVGTDTAMEAADVVIMNDDLRRIPELIRLSRRAHGVLWQNIIVALGTKVGFLVLAVLGSASMWMAVIADVGATLLVVGNGMRMARRTRAEGG